MEHDLCSEDPWLVLHKIDSPTKMRYIGGRVQVTFPAARIPDRTLWLLHHHDEACDPGLV